MKYLHYIFYLIILLFLGCMIYYSYSNDRDFSTMLIAVTALIYLIQAVIATYAVETTNQNSQRANEMNRELLAINQRLTELETKPMIVASVQYKNDMPFIVFKNIGRGIAYDIDVKISNPYYDIVFESKFKNTDKDEVKNRKNAVEKLLENVILIVDVKPFGQMLPQEERSYKLNEFAYLDFDSFNFELVTECYNQFNDKVSSRTVINTKTSDNDAFFEHVDGLIIRNDFNKKIENEEDKDEL